MIRPSEDKPSDAKRDDEALVRGFSKVFGRPVTIEEVREFMDRHRDELRQIIDTHYARLN